MMFHPAFSSLSLSSVVSDPIGSAGAAKTSVLAALLVTGHWSLVTGHSRSVVFQLVLAGCVSALLFATHNPQHLSDILIFVGRVAVRVR